MQNESGKNREVEIDIDELLDMDSDEHRRRFLQVCKYMLNNYYQNINWSFIILFFIIGITSWYKETTTWYKCK